MQMAGSQLIYVGFRAKECAQVSFLGCICWPSVWSWGRSNILYNPWEILAHWSPRKIRLSGEHPDSQVFNLLGVGTFKQNETNVQLNQAHIWLLH